MGIVRRRINLPIRRNFFFIYEGACTEPDYFNGIKRNMHYLGIDDSLISLVEVPKLSLDQNETNIINLINIARDFVLFNKDGVCTVRHLTTVVFESIVRQIQKEKTNYNKIRGNNKALLHLRSIVEDALNQSECVSMGVIDNYSRAVDLATGIIQHHLQCDLHGVNIDFHTRHSVLKDDVVCIIHDRDYHSEFFPDSMYDDAVSLCNRISSDGPEYRLVVTYPKFELWLLMHSNYIFSLLDLKKVTNYEDGSGKRVRFGPSNYVTSLVRHNLPFLFMDDEAGKHISDDDFDFILCNNIGRAIDNSGLDFFVSDVVRLKKEPGTQMGLLLKDMGVRSIH